MTPSDVVDPPPRPLLLLGGREALHLRALESVLTSSGYRVVTADSEQAILAHARDSQPDAILLDAGLAPPGFGLCRTLRTDPAVSLTTPMLLTTEGPTTRSHHLEALRSGAWDVRAEPLDTEELLLRLANYVQGKLELDRTRTEGLVDAPSGLYNTEGIARRAEELGALATRQGLALACAVFRPVRALSTTASGDRLAMAFRVAARASDAVGRTASSEFAVVAPATNSLGAARLVERLTHSVAREVSYRAERGEGRAVPLRAGYTAVLPTHRVSPHVLLARARSVLDETSAS